MSRGALVLFVLCACSTPRGVEPAPAAATSGRVVALDELPLAHAELLEAYGRGGEVWEAKLREIAGDAQLVQFMIDNLIVEVGRAHTSLAGANPARARRAFDRASNELVRYGAEAAPALAEMLSIADSVTAKLVGDLLGRIGSPALPQVLPLLEAQRVETRRRAAHVLGLAAHAGASEAEVRDVLVRHARADAEWMVRAECTLALAARGSRDTQTGPWRSALEAGLKDSDAAVCEAAARGLAQLQDPAAVPALIGALERCARSGELRVFSASQAALVALTGESEQPDVAGWRAWWFEHRAEVERGRTFGRAPRAGG